MIYPMDSVIHLFNNWGQENIYDGTNLFQIPQSISRKNYTHMHGCKFHISLNIISSENCSFCLVQYTVKQYEYHAHYDKLR